MNDRTDLNIIRGLFARNEGAVADLKTKYGKICDRITAGILTDERDREECVNDAYLRLWETIPPAKPVCLRSYLFTTVRNLALNCRRNNRAEKRGGGDTGMELFDELISAETDDPIDTALLADAINRFLSTLAPTPQKVFLQRYYYGMSVTEIAHTCSLSPSNVKVTLSRVRTSFQTYLEKEGFPL